MNTAFFETVMMCFTWKASGKGQMCLKLMKYLRGLLFHLNFAQISLKGIGKGCYLIITVLILKDSVGVISISAISGIDPEPNHKNNSANSQNA